VGTNSWGDDYGIRGRFGFSFNDLERLLNEGGDSVQLVLLDELTPEPKLGSHARQPLCDWAYSKSIWSRFTKSGKAATTSREWLQRKGL
jgi:hypothetical protein